MQRDVKRREETRKDTKRREETRGDAKRCKEMRGDAKRREEMQRREPHSGEGAIRRRDETSARLPKEVEAVESPPESVAEGACP